MNNLIKSRWNPFLPTAKDLARTEELASKNVVTAGALSFVFFPAGLIYLNRGINGLKILGYICAVSFLLGFIVKTKEKSHDLVAYIGLGLFTTEQIITVKRAQNRLQGKSTWTADTFKTNDKYEQLKELKRKHENNEISTEEFQIEKQKLLDSI
ncbi:hypothetical protein Xen7305DRAFT_00013950 [Xenococcus sp. PCC 7305]|uniref:SHOCT domain-containing protein n=1 Tax=Xenococcus sp. PCC 7305 TaxID=102125 RepID=UPI0002ABA09D|nr:SHOCT domain-containing protein [Xenococcus sp. PCC 7305]ELS01690.1 hypothetical protein Xen7305DRAFT_00013950 [Xenococcus sp. PCC 7305]